MFLYLGGNSDLVASIPNLELLKNTTLGTIVEKMTSKLKISFNFLDFERL